MQPPPRRELNVCRADPLKTIAWDQCREAARPIGLGELDAVLQRPLLFDGFHVGSSVIVVPSADEVPKSLWFVGDIHCDLLAMVNAWNYIQERSQAEGLKPHAVFLGDFVDRGPHGTETLWYLWRLLRDFPGQIGVIVGNHDEFTWDTQALRFRVDVEPAETVEQLNQFLSSSDATQMEAVEMARRACAFFAQRPRAIFLPDGTLVAHGGFPHADLLNLLREQNDLNQGACLADFVWLRIANVARRLPARFARGCDFGEENFGDFCRIAGERLGLTVRRMVRGHDHVPQRYEWFPEWKTPVLTINGMCRNIGEFGVDRFPLACVARYQPDDLPAVHQLPLDHEQITRAYYADPQK